jgi:cholesterol oxidase
MAQPSASNGEQVKSRERRPLRMDRAHTYSYHADDGVELRLTRYDGGGKGPVILAPGYGTSSLAFSIDTVDVNFPEYLYANGYDVWLLDYRSSPELPSATTQFTVDDIATRDWPATVEKVREVSGAGDVQVMAHCVGSMSFLMGMMAGMKGVRSAVCSQLTAHPVAPTLNQVKAGLHLADLLPVMGFDTLTTDYEDSHWQESIFDKVLKLYPTHERCNSPVCRRILFMYGEVYKHENLNQATHDAMHEMFGVANMTTFKQLGAIVRAGHIVDKDGKNSYLPHLDRLRIPISFIHGEENGLFLTKGSEITYNVLREANGPDLYTRTVIKNYAHMDCFIGKDSARDVFPIVLAELEKGNAA